MDTLNNDILGLIGEQVEIVRNQRLRRYLEAQFRGNLRRLRREFEIVVETLEKKKRPLKPRNLRFKYVRKAVQNSQFCWHLR